MQMCVSENLKYDIHWEINFKQISINAEKKIIEIKGGRKMIKDKI